MRIDSSLMLPASESITLFLPDCQAPGDLSLTATRLCLPAAVEQPLEQLQVEAAASLADEQAKQQLITATVQRRQQEKQDTLSQAGDALQTEEQQALVSKSLDRE